MSGSHAAIPSLTIVAATASALGATARNEVLILFNPMMGRLGLSFPNPRTSWIVELTTSDSR